MDQKTVNGIEYTFNTDLAGKKSIAWTDKEMDVEIWLFSFKQDEQIMKGICEYNTVRSNVSLLKKAGKTVEQAQNLKTRDLIKAYTGSVQFVPEGGNIQLTENDVKRFMNLITEKHLGFTSYAKDEQSGDWVITP